MGVASSTQPLRDALDLLARFKGQEVNLGLSGGKDSLVTLDLMLRAGVKPRPFFMYFIPGLRCCEENLRPIEARLGLKVIRTLHFTAPRYYREAVYRPHLPAPDAARFRDLTQADVERKIRAETGAEWFAYGMRLTDSLERRGMLNKCQGVDEATHRAYPIWNWADRHVFAYMKQRGIRVPGLTIGRSSGISLRTKVLVFLRDRYPDDYAKVLEVFPYAQAAVFRHDARAQRAQAAEPQAG